MVLVNAVANCIFKLVNVSLDYAVDCYGIVMEDL